MKMILNTFFSNISLSSQYVNEVCRNSKYHLRLHLPVQLQFEIRKEGEQQAAFDPQVARLRSPQPSLSSNKSTLTFYLQLFRGAVPHPPHGVPDRLRQQLRRLYAKPEAGGREVVCSEAPDNVDCYHMQI